MKEKTTTQSNWTRDDVQIHLKKIGMKGVQFSTALKKATNFVTDMKRFGVPPYVEIILTLAVEHKRSGGDPKAILESFLPQINAKTAKKIQTDD